MTDLDKDIQAGHYALDKLRAATHNIVDRLSTRVPYFNAEEIEIAFYDGAEWEEKKEKEKAIDAFKQLQCYGGKDMDCHSCSCRCNLSKFKKLINK